MYDTDLTFSELSKADSDSAILLITSQTETRAGIKEGLCSWLLQPGVCCWDIWQAGGGKPEATCRRMVNQDVV